MWNCLQYFASSHPPSSPHRNESCHTEISRLICRSSRARVLTCVRCVSDASRYRFMCMEKLATTFSHVIAHTQRPQILLHHWLDIKIKQPKVLKVQEAFVHLLSMLLIRLNRQSHAKSLSVNCLLNFIVAYLFPNSLSVSDGDEA